MIKFLASIFNKTMIIPYLAFIKFYNRIYTFSLKIYLDSRCLTIFSIK